MPIILWGDILPEAVAAGRREPSMPGLSFKCKELGFACDFEVKGVATREEIVEIIKSHGKRCHDLDAVTPEIEARMSKAIKD